MSPRRAQGHPYVGGPYDGQFILTPGAPAEAFGYSDRTVHHVEGTAYGDGGVVLRTGFVRYRYERTEVVDVEVGCGWVAYVAGRLTDAAIIRQLRRMGATPDPAIGAMMAARTAAAPPP